MLAVCIITNSWDTVQNSSCRYIAYMETFVGLSHFGKEKLLRTPHLTPGVLHCISHYYTETFAKA